MANELATISTKGARYIVRYQPTVVQDWKNKSTGKMCFGLGWSAAAVIKVTLHNGGQNKPDLERIDMNICFCH
jgi:hypothetical protein